jgi:DNA polymerase-1
VFWYRNYWDALHAELVGISFYEKEKDFMFLFQKIKRSTNFNWKIYFFFENESIEKIGQNLKYDLKILLITMLSCKGKLFDTMIAHYLINPDMRHNMDILSETYFKIFASIHWSLNWKKGKTKNQCEMLNWGNQRICCWRCWCDLATQGNIHLELDKNWNQETFEEIEIRW